MARKRPASQPRQDRAGLYIRVSLDRSARGLQEEILSPETQESRAAAYCQAQGWAVAAVERDIDESGYRQHYSQREGLVRLLAAVERGELTKIVVWKFSRLSRRLREFIEICDRVESAGGGIVSVTEQIDTSTPAGRLIRNILASFAQFQSEELSEQIFENFMTKARRGERPGGSVPYGTLNRRGILEPDPDTHPYLLGMYRACRDRRSIKAAWDYLSANQAPSRRAEAWNLTTIRGILTNPVYIGRLEWAGEVFAGKWDPLVPPELWQAVQDIIDGRRTAPVGRRDARLLTGMLVCGQCGRPMWTRYGKRIEGGAPILARLYWCCNPFNNRRGCDMPYLHGEEVDAVVWQTVLQLLESTDLAEWTARAYSEQLGLEDTDQAHRRRQLLAEQGRVRRAAAQLHDLLDASDISREQFRARNRHYIERLDAVTAELAALPESAKPAFDHEGLVELVARARAASSDQERRDVLISLGAQVRVTQRRTTLHLPGIQVNLQGRMVGATFRFGPEVQRLNWPGPLFTDKQWRFVARTYRWADKHKLAARIGRDYGSVVFMAQKLRHRGDLPPARE